MNDNLIANLAVAVFVVGVLYSDYKKEQSAREYRDRSWWSKFRGKK